MMENELSRLLNEAREAWCNGNDAFPECLRRAIAMVESGHWESVQDVASGGPKVRNSVALTVLLVTAAMSLATWAVVDHGVFDSWSPATTAATCVAAVGLGAALALFERREP